MNFAEVLVSKNGLSRRLRVTLNFVRQYLTTISMSLTFVITECPRPSHQRKISRVFTDSDYGFGILSWPGYHVNVMLD